MPKVMQCYEMCVDTLKIVYLDFNLVLQTNWAYASLPTIKRIMLGLPGCSRPMDIDLFSLHVFIGVALWHYVFGLSIIPSVHPLLLCT